MRLNKKEMSFLAKTYPSANPLSLFSSIDEATELSGDDKS